LPAQTGMLMRIDNSVVIPGAPVSAAPGASGK
jgi:hypothetical protein